MRLMGPSRIISPRLSLRRVTGSGVRPSGDWSTPILAPCTRPPPHFRPVYVREIDFLCECDNTTLVTRSRHDVALGPRGRGVDQGGRRGHRWPECLARARPPAFRPAHPPREYARIIPLPRRRSHRYIRAPAAGRKLIATILRI